MGLLAGLIWVGWLDLGDVLSGELGQELWGDTGGVGGSGGRSAAVNFRTWVKGDITSLVMLAGCVAMAVAVIRWDAKLKGLSSCISADGGGEG